MDLRVRIQTSCTGTRTRSSPTSETTQQGIHQNPPHRTRGIYFAATVSNTVGGNAVVCPLVYGITSIRNYFTFRVQDGPNGAPEAVSYQIIQTSGVFTSGFHALLLDNDTDIPYYDSWNILQPRHSDQAGDAH